MTVQRKLREEEREYVQPGKKRGHNGQRRLNGDPVALLNLMLYAFVFVPRDTAIQKVGNQKIDCFFHLSYLRVLIICGLCGDRKDGKNTRLPKVDTISHISIAEIWKISTQKSSLII